MMRIYPLLMVFFSNICVADIHNDFMRLRYDKRGLPMVDVQIVDRYHTLTLDTGSGEGIHINQYDLEQLIANPSLEAIHQAPLRIKDITGSENQVNAWKIKKLRISNITFNNVLAVSFKPWGFSMGDKIPVNEVMGLGIFQERSFLMDFKNDRLKMLEKLPSDLKKWSSYPIDRAESGLRIRAYVGGKPLYLIVDTGASHSFLFSDNLPSETRFFGCHTIEPKAANADCRVAKITLKDKKGRERNNLAIVTNSVTSKVLDFDGLLGMGFLRGHQVIVDMSGRMLYISR
ncbi:hypothetical protein [Sodalis sp. dw_96]|uniref:hypothetical protein n=1 Tax=Sodalis sp. dw_96 TaxID=2719794 RepID=UPI001BD4C6C2|nr:hypothetical protein [Sodalis sp. dw_96]